MIYRDGKMDDSEGRIISQPIDMESLKKLAESIGESIASKIKISSLISSASRSEDETDEDTLKDIANAMSSGIKNVQDQLSSLGKEEEVKGDSSKTNRTIDLLGEIP